MNPGEFKKAIASYDTLSSMLKTHSYEEILNEAARLTGMTRETMELHPMGGYSKSMASGTYRYTLLDLLKNIRHYDWLYSRLEDDTSRRVFENLVAFRVFPVQKFLKAAYDGKNPQYFDKGIVSCDENEVFVDCGGLTGNTAKEFIRRFGKYKQIYVYEPDQKNLRTCRDTLSNYERVTVRPCVVGEKSDVLTMDSGASSGALAAGSKAAGSQENQIVSLDRDIRDTITFLKLDVGGLEIPALLGAKRHIRDDVPKLAICTHYIISDIWEIPRLIDAIRPGYRFYIRHYDASHNWEIVLYAIPPKAERETHTGGKRRVVAMPAFPGWSNAQLLKDCGVKPYLLYKNHRCEAHMVGGESDSDYSNRQYVKGLQIDFLPDQSMQAKLNYVSKYAGQIDCLMLLGAYSEYAPLADCYKKYNPNGKICMNLDANSGWMDRIQWTDPDYFRLMSQCDIITTSGHVMQRHLNEKWPWAIDYIPNGFYNFSSTPWRVDFDKKKNIILTAGRLGTAEKATDVLLESFAKIAGQVPDWELHLAGGVEESFNIWLNGFWKQYSELKNRIRFLGNIMDRGLLYDTYRQAKIFALPSSVEGGTPNVIAEALSAGCAIAITKIDEHQDAINNGRCGLASEIDDVDGFAEILLRLCQHERLDEMCVDAYKYARSAYDMERIVAQLNKLIFDWEA